jgi:hypothetical protein
VRSSIASSPEAEAECMYSGTVRKGVLVVMQKYKEPLPSRASEIFELTIPELLDWSRETSCLRVM